MGEIGTETATYLSLVISRDAVDNGKESIGAITEMKSDGVLRWIDSHVEEELRKSEVRSYVDFLRWLKNATGTL